MQVSVLTKQERVVKGDVGVEIEIEGNNLYVDVPDEWKIERDGSLRGNFPSQAAEFVFSKPLPIGVATKTIEKLFSLLKVKGAVFNFSFRTSIHVHVNVSDMETVKLANLIYTYLLLEEPLTHFCGKTRKANRFCLRLFDAEGLVDTLVNLIQNDFQNIHRIEEGTVRYAAMNIGSLYKYGSLEFRGMRGTAEVDVINTWINALYALKQYALKQENPITIKEQFDKLGPIAFMEQVLGSLSSSFVYPDIEAEMNRSRSLSLDIPYAWLNRVAVKPRVPRVKVIKPPLNFFEQYVAAKAEGHDQIAEVLFEKYVAEVNAEPMIVNADEGVKIDFRN